MIETKEPSLSLNDDAGRRNDGLAEYNGKCDR